MDKKIELKVLEISNSQAEANAYALVLEEVCGKRQLPIIIGVIEAQSIALKLKKVNFPRPYTHDLFVSFAELFQASLKEVFIYKAVEGVFFSYLYWEKDGEVFQMDSRTSDAVALALRFDASIYTTEDIMNAEGVVVSEEMFEVEMDDDSIESMKKALKKAVEDENYELASALRDIIKQREESDEEDVKDKELSN